LFNIYLEVRLNILWGKRKKFFLVYAGATYGSSIALQNSKDLLFTDRVPVVGIPFSAAELIHITYLWP